MAFQFPDPSVTPEFTGANGITYTWDATDGKSDSVVSSIRSWGAGWLFQGLVLHIANNGGTGTTESHMEVYNLKVGHKSSTNGSGYRIIPVAYRSYSDRAKTSNFAAFSDPYTPK